MKNPHGPEVPIRQFSTRARLTFHANSLGKNVNELKLEVTCAVHYGFDISDVKVFVLFFCSV